MKFKYKLTELNTRKIKFTDDVLDILYGDDYKSRILDTLEDVKELEKDLNSNGVKTSLAKLITDF